MDSFDGASAHPVSSSSPSLSKNASFQCSPNIEVIGVSDLIKTYDPQAAKLASSHKNCDVLPSNSTNKKEVPEILIPDQVDASNSNINLSLKKINTDNSENEISQNIETSTQDALLLLALSSSFDESKLSVSSNSELQSPDTSTNNVKISNEVTGAVSSHPDVGASNLCPTEYNNLSEQKFNRVGLPDNKDEHPDFNSAKLEATIPIMYECCEGTLDTSKGETNPSNEKKQSSCSKAEFFHPSSKIEIDCSSDDTNEKIVHVSRTNVSSPNLLSLVQKTNEENMCLEAISNNKHEKVKVSSSDDNESSYKTFHNNINTCRSKVNFGDSENITNGRLSFSKTSHLKLDSSESDLQQSKNCSKSSGTKLGVSEFQLEADWLVTEQPEQEEVQSKLQLQFIACESVSISPKAHPIRPEFDSINPEVKTLRYETEKIKPEPLSKKHQLEFSKPETELSKPGTELSKPRTELSKPGTELSKPGTELSKPGTELSKPETELSKPETELSKPETEFSKPETELSKPESELSKPESELSKPESELSKQKLNLASQKLNSASQKVNSASQKVNSASQKELSKPESELSKPETELSKPETELSKPETELSKPETELSKPETELSKPETELSKPELN